MKNVLMGRRRLLAAAAVSALMVAQQAHAQSWPQAKTINLVVGYQTPRFGVRGSGMYLGSTVHGFQISPGIHFGPANKAWHGIGAVFGTMNLSDQRFTYGGLAYQLTTRGGFYLEAGLSGGSGDFTTPQLLLQIGGVARIPTNESAKAAKTAPR